MASVVFDVGMFIHDPDNLDDYIVINDRRDPQTTRAPRGDVRVTASGARRWTSQPGHVETIDASWRTKQVADKDWLERREDAVVVYRDRRGRVHTCAVTNVAVSDLNADLYDIAVTLQPIDDDA